MQSSPRRFRSRHTAIIIAAMGSACLILVTALAGCSPTPAELASPAGPGAALPRLATDSDGVVWLSWVEPAEAGHALKYARLGPEGWSEPAEAARGEDWFINWADFPSVIHAGDGRLAAHWLVKREGGPYAYDVAMSVSADAGTTWSAPASPHGDGTATEHGFVSLFPVPGGVGAAWLDGRNTSATGDGEHGGHGGAMTLRVGAIAWDGQPLPDVELDAMTCDCCQTGAARVGHDTVVVYRDRAPGEIRDIQSAVIQPGRAPALAPVADDGWHMPACPVNGPAIAVDKGASDNGGRVAVAWFTAAGDRPRVQLAFSDDAGRHFAAPVLIDDGPNLGRVDVAFAPGGAAVVSWLALEGKDAVIRYRAVAPDGRTGRVHSLAATSQARSSGFPQLAVDGERLVFAWTSVGTPSRVMTATAPLP